MKKLSEAYLPLCPPLSFSPACSLHFLKYRFYQPTPDLSRNMCFIQYIDLVCRKPILLENCGSLKCWCPLQFLTGVSDFLPWSPLVINETRGAGWGQGSCSGLTLILVQGVSFISASLYLSAPSRAKIMPLQLVSCWVFTV